MRCVHGLILLFACTLALDTVFSDAINIHLHMMTFIEQISSFCSHYACQCTNIMERLRI